MKFRNGRRTTLCFMGQWNAVYPTMKIYLTKSSQLSEKIEGWSLLADRGTIFASVEHKPVSLTLKHGI